jgi:hypothetical protein
MKHFSALLLAVSVTALTQAQTRAIDMRMLVGRKAIVQRMPFYQPGTFQQIPNTYAGQTVTIIEVKPSTMFAMMPTLTASQMASLPPQSQQAIENTKTASTIVVQFQDGTKADTGAMPVMASTLPTYLDLLPDQNPSPAVPTSTASAATPAPIPPNSSCPATVTKAACGQAATKQDCPLKLTKIKYAGFGTGLAADMLGMTGQYIPNSPYEIHVTNQSDKETRVIEITTQFFNPMGDVAYIDNGNIVQTKLKPGQSRTTLGTTPLGMLQSDAPSMRAWVTRIKFKDGSFWTDDGSQSCAIESAK